MSFTYHASIFDQKSENKLIYVDMKATFFNNFELNCTFWYKSKRYAGFLLVLLPKKQGDLTALPQDSKEGMP